MPGFTLPNGQVAGAVDSKPLNRRHSIGGLPNDKVLTEVSKADIQQIHRANSTSLTNSPKDQSLSEQDSNRPQSAFTFKDKEKVFQKFKEFDAKVALKKLVESEDKINYYFKPEKSENTPAERQLAFKDEDTHLTAATDLSNEKNAEAAKAMVALAVKKGWASIDVDGTPEFQAEVRKAAAEFGLEVTNHAKENTPAPKTEQEVDEPLQANPESELEVKEQKEKVEPINKISSSTSNISETLLVEFEAKLSAIKKTELKKDEDDLNEPAKVDEGLKEKILLNNRLFEELSKNSNSGANLLNPKK